MTGFGKVNCRINNHAVVIEVRALNGKSLDVNMKLPARYKSKEHDLRTIIGECMNRGKVDVQISLEAQDKDTACSLNTALLEKYCRELAALSDKLGLSATDNLLAASLRLPDVLQQHTETLEESEGEALMEALKEALEQTDGYRLSEGRHLEAAFRNQIGKMESLLTDIPPLEQNRKEAIKSKLLKALEELSFAKTPDPNRFEQELIYYLEKFDITEELVRLEKHLTYFNDTLDSETSSGKKLGFIAQEIGREINTIGSKANDASLQKVVVQMKEELEKIKEQLMNIL